MDADGRPQEGVTYARRGLGKIREPRTAFQLPDGSVKQSGSVLARTRCAKRASGDAGDPVLARDNVTGRIYFATLKGRTYALNALTGHELWSYNDGKYSPVVADAKQLYLVGYGKVYAFAREHAVKTPAKPKKKPAKKTPRKHG